MPDCVSYTQYITCEIHGSKRICGICWAVFMVGISHNNTKSNPAKVSNCTQFKYKTVIRLNLATSKQKSYHKQNIYSDK